MTRRGLRTMELCSVSTSRRDGPSSMSTKSRTWRSRGDSSASMANVPTMNGHTGRCAKSVKERSLGRTSIPTRMTWFAISAGQHTKRGTNPAFFCARREWPEEMSRHRAGKGRAVFRLGKCNPERRPSSTAPAATRTTRGERCLTAGSKLGFFKPCLKHGVLYFLIRRLCRTGITIAWKSMHQNTRSGNG